ncbi:unnamed protein product, partial [Linum tenue]
DIPSSLSDNHLFTNLVWGKSFSLHLALSLSSGILLFGSIGTRRSYLVKYLMTNFYVPFITLFLNNLMYNKPKDLSYSDDIDDSEALSSMCARATYVFFACHSFFAGKKYVKKGRKPLWLLGISLIF